MKVVAVTAIVPPTTAPVLYPASTARDAVICDGVEVWECDGATEPVDVDESDAASTYAYTVELSRPTR